MGTATIHSNFYPEVAAGGFTRIDGTVEFYSRVNALIEPHMTVVDLGAGRGQQFEGASAFRRELVKLKGKVARVIGVDVDEAVLENPQLDEARVYDGGKLPLEDASADVILSDWTLEHIADAKLLASEVHRVLKPGGWFCARTPHLFSALVVVSSLVPNRRHAALLSKVQPGREARDVFPTAYKLNTLGALQKHFSPTAWQHHSYTASPEPSYHFGNRALYRLMQAYQYLKRPFLGGECLFVFMRKR